MVKYYLLSMEKNYNWMFYVWKQLNGNSRINDGRIIYNIYIKYK